LQKVDELLACWALLSASLSGLRCASAKRRRRRIASKSQSQPASQREVKSDVALSGNSTGEHALSASFILQMTQFHARMMMMKMMDGSC
jgi:hypothetical protein